MYKKNQTILLYFLPIVYFLFTSLALSAQSPMYTELPNPQKPNPSQWQEMKGISVAWGSIDLRYPKEQPAKIDFSQKKIKQIAWRGERINSQLVISNTSDHAQLSYRIHSLTSSEGVSLVQSDEIYAGFVRYVMTDGLNKNGKGTCGLRNSKDFDSTLVADPIDHHTATIEMQPMQTQAIWVGVDIPRTAQVGSYKTTVEIFNQEAKIEELTLSIEVIDETLPSAKEQRFHLDLWQNPYAVARYYGVPLWSEAHLAHLTRDMQHYADAGGKVITTSLIHKPWNGQTYDHFEAMIKWIKKSDGSWTYDFTDFDRWVELMMKLGVDQQINCYSMIPWEESFRYFDQKTNRHQWLKATPGSLAYKNHWTPFLKAFAQHLKSKKWFEKTYISMDERPMHKMQATLSVIKNAVPDFKVSLAGALHTELVDELDDYCVSLRMKFSPSQIQKRREEKRITTFYTSCEEPYPNTFTFSQPADSEWFAWYAAQAGLDGYLRWALNSWVKSPLQDSRFTAWGAGDAYMIYPHGISSIRYERLKMGIQNFEKIQILKEKYHTNKAWSKSYLLDKLLSDFDEKKLTMTNAATIIQRAKTSLQQLIDKEETLISEALADQLRIAKGITLRNYPIGNEPNQYDPQKWKALQNTIDQATAMLQDSQSTQQQIDTLLKKLIEAVDVFKNSKRPPFVYSDKQKATWYQIVDRRSPKSYMYVAARGGEVPNQLKWTAQNNPRNDNQLFKFVKKEDTSTSFYFYSKANPNHPLSISKRDNSIIAVEDNRGKESWQLIPTSIKNYYLIQFADGDETMRLNSYRSHNDKIGFWGPAPDDLGNQWTFVQQTTQGVGDTHIADGGVYFSVKDKHIIPHDNTMAYSLYSIAGEQIDPNTALVQGIYIIKIDHSGKSLKIVVE